MSGMCGSVSRSGALCGALLGGVAALGLLFGRDLPTDDKTLCYTLSYQYAEEFTKKFGSRNCAGILPCDISTKEGAVEFQQGEYGSTICPSVTEKAAGLVQEIINRKEEFKHPLL